MPFLEKDTEPLTASLGLSSDDIPSFVEQTVSDLGCPSAAVLRGAMNHEQLETRAAMFQQDHRLQEPIRSLQQAVDIWMKRSLKARSDSLFTTLFNSLKQQGFQAREDQTRLTKSRIEEKRRRLLVEVETKRVLLMRLLSRSIRQAWNVVPRPEPMTAAYVQAKRRWGEGRGYTTDVARMCKIGSQGRLQERVAASLGELNHVRRLTTEIRECVERGFAQMVAMACTAAASEAPVSEASRQCLTALEDLLTAGRARVSEAVDEFATQLDDGERSLPAPLAPPMFRMLLEEEDDEEE